MSRDCPEEEVSERAAKRGHPEGDRTGSKTHGEFRRWVLRNWNDSPKERGGTTPRLLLTRLQGAVGAPLNSPAF